LTVSFVESRTYFVNYWYDRNTGTVSSVE